MSLAHALPPGLWDGLLVEAVEHQAGLTAALVALCLLALLRAVRAARLGRRLRFPAVMMLLYLASFPVRVLIERESANPQLVHSVSTLTADVLVAFGWIAIVTLLLFDLRDGPLARMRILRDIVAMVAGFVVVLVVLARAHVNVLSLVTTSAVLTAIIGLALQDTLGNVLSGVAMQLESTLSIGDWVRVGEVEGKVAEIRWRSTAILTRDDDLVVIPNASLAKQTIVNLSRPHAWHRRTVRFYVHFRHAPNLVEQVVLEAIRGVAAMRTDPAPDCILDKIDGDNASFAVRYWLADLSIDTVVDAEIRKRIWYALGRAGIEIPYAIHNVFLTNMGDEQRAKLEQELRRRHDLLRGVDLFSPLDDHNLEILAARLRDELYGEGEIILRQGDAGDSLYLVRRGEVSVRVLVDGAERDVAVVRQGEFFGEMSLMTGEARRATVVARGDVECYVIDRPLFQEVLAGRDTLVEEITAILARRQVSLEGQVADMESRRASDERQADLLQRMKRFFGFG